MLTKPLIETLFKNHHVTTGRGAEYPLFETVVSTTLPGGEIDAVVYADYRNEDDALAGHLRALGDMLRAAQWLSIVGGVDVEDAG